MSTELVKEETIKKLDQSVLAVIGNQTLMGFEKAHIVSKAMVELKQSLTTEFMQPILALQGSRLGFKTDKDKTGGYPAEVVKACLIDAVLMGLQPTGNQFNILQGSCYPTKEGCRYLLSKIQGLNYSVKPGLPKINAEKTGAEISMSVKWNINGKAHEETLDLAIKADSYTTVDAVVGKGTRKAYAWLLGQVTGLEITDAETEDADFKVLSTKALINPDELQFLYENNKDLLSEGEKKSCERVLKNKEEASYQKVKDLLESKIGK